MPELMQSRGNKGKKVPHFAQFTCWSYPMPKEKEKAKTHEKKLP